MDRCLLLVKIQSNLLLIPLNYYNYVLPQNNDDDDNNNEKKKIINDVY